MKYSCMNVATFAFLSAAGRGALAFMSPSTSVESYLTTHLEGVGFTSILTVDDGMTVPLAGSTTGETTELAGIPDGLAAIDGSELNPPEPDFFYLLANHELSVTQGDVRAHGGVGAFVSKWKISKDTLEVVEGEDLVKEFYGWNWDTEDFEIQVTNFNRICSGDRPRATALFNSATGLGTEEVIYFTGEESAGGRHIAHVFSGVDAGKSFELAHFGYTAVENVVFNPFEQDLTVAISSDDSADGELYVYVGTKQAEGNDVQKAGLVGGNLYAIAVEDKPHELDDLLAKRVITGDRFSLKPIGAPGNRPTNGTETTVRGDDAEGVYFPDSEVLFPALRLPGPEDSAWDYRPGLENNLYFVTKGGYFAGSSVNGLTAPSRLYRLEFDDITNPTLGGTIHVEFEGLRAFDNIAVEIFDESAKVYIQEDNGGSPTLSRLLEYDISLGSMAEIASFDPEIFYNKWGDQFLTTNEESAGIISLKDILGDGWFATSIQVHTPLGLSNPDVQVEHGQVVIFQIAPDREADAALDEVISSGDSWDYRIDGVDPGADWTTVGYALDDGWNVNVAGDATGMAATPIGYGEAEGVLATNVGSPDIPRPAASFFRKEFDVATPADVVKMELLMLIDDGAVVYINGVEVYRYNMGLDITIAFDTFAAVGEAAERNWKMIPITNYGDFTLTETGNILAVSMHQDTPDSSDIRLDAKLCLSYASTSPGEPPVDPILMNVTALSYNEVEVTWEPQEGVKAYQLERQVVGDLAWEVVDYEIPGTLTSIVDVDVRGLETFNYRMIASNIHGMSAYSEIVDVLVPANPVPRVFYEDFEEADSFGQFTVVDVQGPDATWTWQLWDFSTTGAVQGNGFGASNITEDWLIMTDPFNFAYFSDQELLFDAQQSFSGPLPEVLFSADYDPDIHADPNDADWTLIIADASAEGSLVPQGPFSLSEIATFKGKLAWKYTSAGGAGGESSRYTIDDIEIKALCGFDFEGGENIPIDGTNTWQVVNANSAFTWQYDTYGELQGAFNNNFGSAAGGEMDGQAADDWLIGPPFAAMDTNYVIKFDYYERFGDAIDDPLTLLVTDDYTGDANTTWIDVTPEGLDGSTSDAWITVKTTPLPIQGDNLVMAFRYQASGTGAGTTKRIGVDKVCVEQESGALQGEFAAVQSGAEITLVADFAGGAFPYECMVDFGNGDVVSECNPTYTYSEAGDYTVTATVVDSAETTLSQDIAISVTNVILPPKIKDVRVAVFNTAFSDKVPGYGALAEALKGTENEAIKTTAEVIQLANADIIALNEFDHVWSEDGVYDHDATVEAVVNFKMNYLALSQNGQEPIDYEYIFVAPCNTGVQSGYDFDNNGQSGDGNDAFGFGLYPGQYSLLFLSKYPIVEDEIRTFQTFLWKDMPDAFLPPDPNDSDGDGDTSSYYNSTELDIFRLSSKSHWDVPCEINGEIYHFLMSHPTPPVFDDGEAESYPDPSVADWNGLRNHDEIRFWADYVGNADYIYDDNGITGGLAEGSYFCILGDQNADPFDGDATFNPALLLLDSELIQTDITPTSEGGAEQVRDNYQARETKTSSFDLRVDYVLPSIAGWKMEQAAVLWPKRSDMEYSFVVGKDVSSDHRLVMMDATLPGGATEKPTDETTPEPTPPGGDSAVLWKSQASMHVLASIMILVAFL